MIYVFIDNDLNLIRAVNEPSEPSFWQNWLGSLVRKYIRAGPELEPSLKTNAQTRLNREIICSGSSLGSPKRDTRAEPSTRVARLDSSSRNRPQFVGQFAKPEPEPGPSERATRALNCGLGPIRLVRERKKKNSKTKKNTKIHSEL
jgi:hypothetical protein